MIQQDINKRRDTAYRLLEIANRHLEISPMLREFVAELKMLTGCRAAGIRILDEEGNIPYADYDGFSRAFFEKESPLVIHSDRCMCINVITGRTNPSLPYYTEAGSFWMNHTTRFLATVSEAEKGKTRNTCNAYGYESVALIPIRSVQESIAGLIHLADTREGMVPLSTVHELEQAGLILGSAIQRVRLTQTQRDSEAQFRLLFDNAFDAILLWEKFGDGPDFRIIEANRVACDRYGYSHDEMLRLTGKDLATPESYIRGQSGDVMRELVTQGHATYQVVHRTKDGRPITSEVSGHLFTLNGKTVVLSVCRDITERQKQEAEIRSLASFPLTNPNPVIRVLPDATIIFANPSADALLAHWKTRRNEILPPPVSDKVAETFTSRQKSEIEVSCGNITYLLTIFPDVSNGFLNLYALDITHRKQTEKELKENRDHLEKLNNSLPDAIFVVRRPDRRIEYVNHRVQQTFGYSPEECLGKTPEFLFASHGAYLAQARRVSEAIRRGTSGEGLRSEVTQRRKSGEIFLCELIQTFTCHPDGTITVITIARDITEQRRALQEIEGYQQRLEDMVAARTEALNAEIASRQKAELELRSLYEREQTLSGALRQQIEERSLFTRALVHELKTPLTPLLTASDFLEANLDDETNRNFARNIKLGAHNMEKRINEMLDLARGEVGTLRLTYRSFDLKELLEETAGYVRPDVFRRGQHLELDLPESPLPMQADPDRLRQVVLNLLSNSFKFSRKGGHIHLSLKTEPDGAVVSVADTGAGIATADLPYIFQPYHRGRNTDKNRLGGLGLGLVLSKMIVELHGGQIWLKSAVGKGSTFSFKIPYTKQ